MDQNVKITDKDKNSSTIEDPVEFSELSFQRYSDRPIILAPSHKESNIQEKFKRNNDLQHMCDLESKSRESHKPQSKASVSSPTRNSIASNPSVDLSTDEGTFLKAEIDSFFSTKEPNISNLKSETGRPSSQTNPAEESFPGDVTFNTSVDTQTTGTITSDKGKFNRLGIVPFNPKETGKSTRSSLIKQELPITGAQNLESANQQFHKKLDQKKSKNSRRDNAKLPSNSPRNTSDAGINFHDIVPPSNIRVSPRNRIHRRDKQEGSSAKLKNVVLERYADTPTNKSNTPVDDPDISMTQVAMTSLQSGTRKIASLFESRLSGEKDEMGRQDQPKSNKHHIALKNNPSLTSMQRNSTYYRDEAKPIINTSENMDNNERIKHNTSESMKTVMQSGAQNLITMFESKVPAIPKGQNIWNNRRSAKSASIRPQMKTQQTNQINNEPRASHELVPPTFVKNNRVPTRASFSNSTQTNEQANFNPSSFTMAHKKSFSPPQKAKSLISIFESKKPANDAPPLFPHSEHWQYGKMRGG